MVETDEELARRARQSMEGDTRAFEEIVRRHQSSVLANCRYLTGSAEDAEDLAQEVFAKAYFRLESFEERSRFKTWIQKVKVNHCLNFLRGKKGRPHVDIEAPGIQATEGLQVAASAHRERVRTEEREKVRMVLDALPDHHRLPLILCDLDGLSYQEIADTLGVGLSAAKMRIKRAREEFRSRFEGLGGRAWEGK